MNSYKNLIFYFVMIGFFILLKFGYTLTETNHLTFLLSPTSKLVEFVTGFQSIYADSKGYYFQELNIVIDKSCAGFNFWILSFLMLTFLSLKYFEKINDKVIAIIISFFGAYLFTVLINSFRINVVVIFQNKIELLTNLRKGIIHESIGITINLTFLVLIYLITEKILNFKKRNGKLT
ncbi:exosortase K [Polaribacter sp. Z022]|uniref:exosortase K n=1 Tax=Polaribacter sp. Z022 TaxID=2927125 RepID=UPI00202171B3|nr:exosortase K [Polaribacter sp. Z022]MCL7752735.1 exosortase K [Polaribacter sp. Z022]